MEAYYTDMSCYSAGAKKQAASSNDALVVGCTDGGSGSFYLDLMQSRSRIARLQQAALQVHSRSFPRRGSLKRASKHTGELCLQLGGVQMVSRVLQYPLAHYR